MSAIASFRVGDKVVYPNQGVGVIEHISRRDLGESGQEFYLLRIEANNLRVLVPLTSAANIGIRPVTGAAEMTPILGFLQCPDRFPCASDWKGRFRENSDKMRGGVLAQVAEVLKSLVQLHHAKPLSFREKKMLDRAAMLLAAELASASNTTVEQAYERVQECLSKASLVLPPQTPENSR
ncbi:MAG TPA: CarD family transcriptional regulator [Terriglobales bacterium]|nr:CarD family transcriptional regulator [Terriglobales bacterium]